MINSIGKEVKYIVSDDIRCYLTEYQAEKKSSKVTIDNIHRILSSFFSWLEDEDYVAEQLAQLLEELKQEKNSFQKMSIDYEEKAFYDILKATARKYEFDYPPITLDDVYKEVLEQAENFKKYAV